MRGLAAWAAIAWVAVLVAGAQALAEDFYEQLKRVDRGLKQNPHRVSWQALESCKARRNTAVRLYDMRLEARARRSLRFCMNLLGIPLEPPKPVAASAPTMEEMQARAVAEIERALSLAPDVEHGLAIYRECAACHTPEGWGLSSGIVPQIAGQHRSVVIKQLADIRAGNRDAVLMLPYASVEAIGGTQAVADVAAYIDTLEISIQNDKGPGEELDLGEELYAEHCASCHGIRGEGDAEAAVPRIQSQHYDYLVRQFESIRDGRRRNANAEMVAQIGDFTEREIHAVLDYVSRLEPPAELVAAPGWRNPDFAEPPTDGSGEGAS